MGVANPTYHTIKGSSDIIRLTNKRSWNPTDGIQTFKRWQGTADVITAKFNELSAADAPGVDNLEEDIDGKGGRLVGRVIEDSGGSAGGNTEALNAVWEVYASPLYKPIESHTDFDAVTTKRKRYVEKAARDAEALDAAGTDAEKKLYAYYSDQILDFRMTQLELRKSTILSSRSAITASYANLNEVVTLASIAPPSTLIGALTSLPLMSGALGEWQWLKIEPQTRQVAKRKFQLSYAWLGAERWADIYPNGTYVPTYA